MRLYSSGDLTELQLEYHASLEAPICFVYRPLAASDMLAENG